MKLETKEAYDAKWLKLFYHNSKSGDFFDNKNESILSLKKANLYSILWYLPFIRTFEEGKFEFLLEYPQIPSKYNRWSQASNPLINTVVSGFVSKGMSWTDNSNGLRRFESDNTLITASTKSSGWWHLAIGAVKTSSKPNTFPGPYEFGNWVNEVYLWIRVSSFANMIRGIPNAAKCTGCRKNNSISFFIITIILS